MQTRRNDAIAEKLFSRHMLALAIFGLAVNVGLARLVLWLGLPLYLDNVGSVLVAALGGALPGMAVAFVSNLIGSAGDPDALYFGVLTILIALAASEFSRRGWLKSVRGALAASAVFMLLGGAGGSGISWLLYGGEMGGTISEPYALWLFAHGLPKFWAQFTADMLVDGWDKLLTTCLVFLCLRFYPGRLYDRFPLSYLYDRSEAERQRVSRQQQAHYRKISIHTRIIRLITLSLLVLSVLATTVGGLCYWYAEKALYARSSSNLARVAAGLVDGDRMDEYLAEGEAAAGYSETARALEKVFRDTAGTAYLYVYQIRADGCHVVFDFDTPDVPGDKRGAVLALDRDLEPYRAQLLAGGEVPTAFSHSAYGWLLTGYAPIRDSAGRTTAYAGVDISAASLVKDLLSYLIHIITVEFGASFLVIGTATRYAQKRVAAPIDALVGQSLAFDRTDPEVWLTNGVWIERVPVETGDELETLYQTICGVEENVAHSVTQLRESERQLVKAAKLERKNRELTEAVKRADAINAAKTEFYSRMSHDMRTPMNGIIGLAGLSAQETDPAVLRENLRKIGEAGGYLLSLINDTLDISKLEQKKLVLNEAPFHAQRFVDSLTDMLLPSAREKNLTFQIVNEGVRTDVYAVGDELRLKQIFMNLLSNAIKFTPPGGSITLVLQSRGEDAHAAHDRFILRDTGVGMSAEFMENGLFEPFSQEHSSLTAQYAGTGLGLAIVKNLVELMHGSIFAESVQGEGTEFVVDLDFRLVEPEQVLPDTPQQRAPSVLRGKRILLCEDNDLNAEIAVQLLRNVGIEVERAENGQEAVDRFGRSAPGAFDGILMDIRMPVMDGITAARLLRGLKRPDAKTVPIIAMTANAYLEDREQTRAAGMNAHLSKPIDVQKFYATLAAFLDPAKASGPV